jgi:cell division protein FtsQ
MKKKRRSHQAEPTKRNLTASRRPVMRLAAVVTFGMLVVLGYTGRQLADPASLPIRKVAVEGDFRHLNPDHVQSLVSSAVDAGFFGINVRAIREKLLDEPWLYDASIRRVWPDTLRVSIREQEPVAYWGEHALLNEEADIFVPERETMPPNLPILNGPVGTELEVLKHYQVIRKQFAHSGLKVVRVDLSERRAWTIETEGGTRVVIGRHSIEERLSRFGRGFELALKHHWEKIGVVDLRYTNGFAITERAARTGNG